MKKILSVLWQFLEAWGRYRYEMSKRHGFRY